jgi:deoxyadenosine/deoxycytidine kinase
MLVSIIGNNASGKTSLAAALDREPGFTAYLESHYDRPYQSLFSQDPARYALPNQIDFLLTRAEQERALRAAGGIGVQDGGLEQDFYLYTQLFHRKGFLTAKEFDLCRRLYATLRASLPAPEVYIYLTAPVELLRNRLLARGRVIDLKSIVTLDDLPILQDYLDTWVVGISPLALQAEEVELDSPEFVSDLAARIRER